jgi:hypothetical protein
VAARKHRWHYVFGKLTSEQFEALLYTLPGPLGAGLTPTQYSILRGVSTANYQAQMCRIRKNFPKAWEQIKAIKHCCSRQERNLHRPRPEIAIEQSVVLETF